MNNLQAAAVLSLTIFITGCGGGGGGDETAQESTTNVLSEEVTAEQETQEESVETIAGKTSDEVDYKANGIAFDTVGNKNAIISVDNAEAIADEARHVLWSLFSFTNTFSGQLGLYDEIAQNPNQQTDINVVSDCEYAGKMGVKEYGHSTSELSGSKGQRVYIAGDNSTVEYELCAHSEFSNEVLNGKLYYTVNSGVWVDEHAMDPGKRFVRADMLSRNNATSNELTYYLNGAGYQTSSRDEVTFYNTMPMTLFLDDAENAPIFTIENRVEVKSTRMATCCSNVSNTMLGVSSSMLVSSHSSNLTYKVRIRTSIVNDIVTDSGMIEGVYEVTSGEGVIRVTLNSVNGNSWAQYTVDIDGDGNIEGAGSLPYFQQ